MSRPRTLPDNWLGTTTKKRTRAAEREPELGPVPPTPPEVSQAASRLLDRYQAHDLADMLGLA